MVSAESHRRESPARECVRRLAAPVAVSLAVGAIVTLVVAWIGPLWASPTPTYILALVHRVADLPAPLQRELDDAERDGLGEGQVLLTRFRHRLVDVDEIAVLHEGRSATRFAGGWPLRALHGWTSTRRDPAGPGKLVANSGLIEPPGFLRPASVPLHSSPRRLPVRPILPGFLLNTIVAAAIVFLVFFSWREVRRLRRGHAGRCVACGYDLAGNTGFCPECGRGRTLSP